MSENTDYLNKDRVAELRSELEAIGDSLAELAMDSLQSAINAGESKPPVSDKKITQARRAVEKAVRTLDFE